MEPGRPEMPVFLGNQNAKKPGEVFHDAAAAGLVDVVDDPLLGRRRVEIHGLSEARADSERSFQEH